MLSIGWGEMLVIALVALVVVGPDRWPELARTLGRYYGKIRRASFEARQTISTEMDMLKSQIDPHLQEDGNPQDKPEAPDPSGQASPSVSMAKDTLSTHSKDQS